MKGSPAEIEFMKFCESLGIKFIDVSEEANEDKRQNQNN